MFRQNKHGRRYFLMEKSIKRGEIYLADLRPVVGSEQGGVRPVVIIQNEKGNQYSPTTIIVTLSTCNKKSQMPTHVKIHKTHKNGLNSDSVALCEQLRTIDKQRIKDRIGMLDENTLGDVLSAVAVSLEM
jgi:mRNA interferase MazF